VSPGRSRWLALLAAIPVSLGVPVSFGAPAGELPAGATGLQPDVIFTDYSPLSRSLELARRLLTPLANQELNRVSANTHTALREQPVDLSQESFAVYVPPNAPPAGYGLLAFIPPWDKAYLPAGWTYVLDQHGMIFVSASRSGNPQNVVDRRIPLALLGAYNIMQRYPIDQRRVYIGGFSGGSRVAMRVALAYPDLFHGALLNAGSDPIGTNEAVLPSTDLFEQFQTSSRLIYVTGERDSWNIDHDADSVHTMNSWCVFGTSIEKMVNEGHEAADPRALSRALSSLGELSGPDPEKLAACRQRIARALAADLMKARDLVDHGQTHDAWRLLTKIDARYGRLAVPDSIELAERIGTRR